jgi:hypothetical protein
MPLTIGCYLQHTMILEDNINKKGRENNMEHQVFLKLL